MDGVALAVLMIGAGLLLAFAIRVVPESQRLAVTAGGRFLKLRGPGIVLTWPGSAYHYHRLSIGDVGDVGSNEVFATRELAVPYVSDATIRGGKRAKIVGFSDTALRIEPVSDTVICEHCGNANEI